MNPYTFSDRLVMATRARYKVIFLLSIIFSLAECNSYIEEMSEKLDKMLLDTKAPRYSRNIDDSQIWQQYKFGTGSGNRDELIVTDVEVQVDVELKIAINNWQLLETMNGRYLAGTDGSMLYLYKLDLQNGHMFSKLLVKFPSRTESSLKIVTFKLLDMPKSDTDTSDLIVILCVELNYVTKLQWYTISNNSVEEFWSWPVQENVERFEIVRHKDQNIIVLLNEAKSYPEKYSSHIYIYGFRIDENLPLSWLIQKLPVSNVLNLEVCPFYDNTVVILQAQNEVFVYELKDEITEMGRFIQIQSVTSNGLNNVICFESGYMQYLGISGQEPDILTFSENEFLDDIQTEKLLNEIDEVTRMIDIPVDSYKDESLLLIQSKNSSVIALSWCGQTFKKISLPENIDHFDLAKIIPIPKFGFLYENTFVKIDTKLQDVSKPVRDEMEELLKLKSNLEGVLEKQELILDRTAVLMNNSYFNNPEITGFWNFTEVHTETAIIYENATCHSITMGPTFLTVEDMHANINSSIDVLKEIYYKTEEIASNLANAIPAHVTELNLNENIEIEGNIEIGETLSVNNLTLDYLNHVKHTEILQEFIYGDNDVIEGEKWFPHIDFEKLEIYFVNDVPMKNIVFDTTTSNYENVDFSKLDHLIVEGDLSFSTINSRNWKNLLNNIVFKSKSYVIPGETIVNGEIVADYVNVDNVNGLRYPNDYVLRNSTSMVLVTGQKTFDTLTATKLSGIKYLNGIPIEDYVIIDRNQSLTEEITFDNLKVTGNLLIDINITDQRVEPIELGPNLEQSNVITSDVTFTNLQVIGNVIVEKSVNERKWSDFDDIVFHDDINAKISGKKTFLGRINIDNEDISDIQKINGHSINEFVNIVDEQEFPYLTKISSDVSFGELKQGVTTELQNFLNENVDEFGNAKCFSKINFEQTPVIDNLNFDTVNGFISHSEFSNRLNRTFAQMNFNKVSMKNLIVPDIVANTINGVDFSDFEKRRLSKSVAQNLTGNFTFENLETNYLNAQFFNGIYVQELERLRFNEDTLINNILNGSTAIDFLMVTGNVQTPKINGKNVNEIFTPAKMGMVIFETDVSIENLIVLGHVNDFDFNERVADLILKTDRNIVVSGMKTFDRIMCQEFDVNFINRYSINSILDPEKDQQLTGPITVNGVVTVESNFECNGKIDGIPFKDLINRFSYSENNTLILRGNFQFANDVRITNLIVNGPIQDMPFDSFFDTVIFPKDDMSISGTKIFQGSVTFENNFTILDKYNSVNLKEFYEHVVFIDEPIFITSDVNFHDDVFVMQNISANRGMETRFIMEIDIDELKANAVHLNRNSYIIGPIAFTDVIFDTGINVETLNGINIHSLITLNSQQVIADRISCPSFSVNNLEITGFVNGYDLNKIYEDTFMLRGDQNVTGHITFYGPVYTLQNFDAVYINEISTSQYVYVNENDTVFGNLTFKQPITLSGSLRILGLLNDVINPIGWEGIAVTTSFPINQEVNGRWVVHGNVHFEKDVTGNKIVNGNNVEKLADKVEKAQLTLDAIIAETKTDMKSICHDLELLRNRATTQIYQFKYFEYLRILNFDTSVWSIHQFEYNDLDYLIINFGTCDVKTFIYYNGTFDSVEEANVLDFGLIDRWISLSYKKIPYFLTLGKSGCRRDGGNLWKFENNQFTHVYYFGNVTDVTKLGMDYFLVLADKHLQKWSIDQIYQESFVIPKSYPINDENSKFIPNFEKVLLMDERSIYEYNVEFMNYTYVQNEFGNDETFGFKLGVFERTMFLSYDENISPEYIFIYDNDATGRKIEQTIRAHNPKSFSILNFDDFIENFLVFIENGNKLQIYEYLGIQGFVYRESIKMEAQKLFTFKLRIHKNLSKRHCLGVIHNNRLTILESTMYGEKLDMNELDCNN
ncbi:uncharacterized protein LOC107272713 [Cephus cinctus]|uniref:Uncharacterized protein LOC107272713 n=1 Tax=Cephus cinctus TaxID=211228 RepID=A0AAJ7FS56_CEPCN|nr:uncharacterized protein LOC107272713 [Cephus cinctus]